MVKSDIEIGLLFGWSIAFLLVISIIIFFLNYRSKILKIEKENQRNAFKASIDSEERIKEKTANNLHDEVITLLTSVGQNIERHQMNFNNDTFKASDLDKETETLNDSISKIRSIALDLIPSTFLNFGLIKAIEQYARQLNPESISLEFEDKTNSENIIPFSKNEQLGIYRICQEVLNNLYKHAGYTYLRVTISINEINMHIEFTHDGKGISNEEIEFHTNTSKGLGLKFILSRLWLLGASISYSKLETPRIDLSFPFSS